MQSDPQLRETAVRRAEFIRAYRQTGNVTAACALSQVGRSTVYLWQDDPEFAAEMADAGEEACDLLEIEARRRAVDGVERLKFDKEGNALRDPRGRSDPFSDAAASDDAGGPIYVEREYSDGLLQFLLRAHRPRKYSSKLDVTSGGEPLAKAYVGIDIDRV